MSQQVSRTLYQTGENNVTKNFFYVKLVSIRDSLRTSVVASDLENRHTTR